MRLDKYLADMGIGTRSDLKKAIRSGAVSVNGQIVKQADLKVNAEDEILWYGEKIVWNEYEYYMMNKPAGVLSATEDPHQATVLDLIGWDGVPDPDEAGLWRGRGVGPGARRDLSPVGRLDKDTEGFLLLTNDGQLAHRLLAPGKHVPKRYLARLDRPADEADVKAFAAGMRVPEDPTAGNGRGRESFDAKPAELVLLDGTEAIVEITEGRYHQVKRMFAARGKTVLYLKRIAMGGLELDKTLRPGEYRELTTEEIQKL